jgi:hypothetical protein
LLSQRQALTCGGWRRMIAPRSLTALAEPGKYAPKFSAEHR